VVVRGEGARESRPFIWVKLERKTVCTGRKELDALKGTITGGEVLGAYGPLKGVKG